MLVAVVAGGWLALRPSTGLPSGKWTIGVHVPLSGNAPADGIAVRNAVQLAVDQKNEDGTLAGVELGVRAFDTGDKTYGESPDRSAAAVREMAGDPRTIAGVGPFISYAAERTIPITNRAGLLECNPSNSDPQLTKPAYGALKLRKAHPDRINYVRLAPSFDVLGRALAAYATHDLDAESALVVTHPEFADLAPDFVKAFNALGGQAEKATFPEGGTIVDARKLLRKAAPPDVVVFAGDTDHGAAQVRKAMRAVGLGSTPFLSWDTIYDGSGRDRNSYLHQAGKDAVGSYAALSSIAPPRVDFVDAYRARFGEDPTDYAAAAYACAQIILAALETSADDGPSADELREAVRAHAVDPANRYETVLGTLGFDENGDSTQQVVSLYRVDPAGADGAGDWALIKQQDYGPQQ